LLLLPGGGDELQGIKKGIVELADGVLINKADGANRMLAEQARAEYSSALHYLTPATPGWRTEVGLCSALTGDGIASAWDTVLRFYRELEPKEVIRRRRDQQNMAWLETLMREELPRRFFADATVRHRLELLREKVRRGEQTAAWAAEELFHGFAPFASAPPGTERKT